MSTHPQAGTGPETRWRKRPVTVEAIQWTGGNLAEVKEFAGNGYFDAVPPEDRDPDPDMTAQVYDKLHGTWVHVYDSQWVIRGIQGELYPCAGDVFAATYEPAETPLPVAAALDPKHLQAALEALSIAVAGAEYEHQRNRYKAAWAYLDALEGKDGTEEGAAVVLCPACLHDGVLERTLERAETAEGKLAAMRGLCSEPLRARGFRPGTTGVIEEQYLRVADILAIIGSEEEARNGR